jgi:hypothetical protein
LKVSLNDNRSLFQIGNTNIDISKQQAITAAENYVQNYNYLVNFGNGTIATIKDLGINETSISADLSTTSRDARTLYPYWSVQVPLEHTYPAETYSITIDVWADSGIIFNAQREISSTTIPKPNLSFDPKALIAFLEIVAIAIILILVAIVAAVLVYVFKFDKQKKAPT